jgi:hypothetical protein
MADRGLILAENSSKRRKEEELVQNDWNDLDRAIYALGKSTSELPEMFRRLTEGELCALIPYHPEVVDTTMQIENGSPFNFVMATDGEGEAVLLYTSEARAEEGLKMAQVPPNTYCTARMAARQMLDVLGRMNMRALLNRSCATGCFLMPADLMRDLVSGAALEPMPLATEEQEHVLNLIDPADYPTDLIQPLFESLRRHQEFRAAWVLRHPAPTAGGGTHYQIMLLMDPRDEVIVHDFNLVLVSACQAPDEVSFGLLDEDDHAYTEALLQRVAPFYAAPDFDLGSGEEAES